MADADAARQDAAHAAAFDELSALIRRGSYVPGPELRAAVGRLNSTIARLDRLGRRAGLTPAG